MRTNKQGFETTALRADQHGLESKEYRAPREPEDSLEPTPEMLAKRRAAAQENKDSKAK